MDVLKKLMAQIHAQVTELSVSQKMLIGTLVLVIPMMLWVVASYSGTSSMLPVLDQPMDDAARAKIVGYLQSNRIQFEQSGSHILVAADKRPAVIAQLALSNMLPSDTSTGFKKFLEEQSWWWSDNHRTKYFDISLQNHLSSVIGEFPWVSDATVIISRPVGLAFARPKMRPTASVKVNVITGRLNQRKVQSVADFVAGAIAEMRTQDVKVIDAVGGRSYTVDSDMGADPGMFIETISSIEKYFQKKIEKQFERVAKGIQVGVSVDVDMTRSQSEEKIIKKENSATLLSRARTRTQETKAVTPKGEPGVRANANMSIPRGAVSGTTQTDEEKEEQFTTHPGHKIIQSQLPVGMPTRVSAAIHVPRTYFVNLFKEQNPDVEGDPTQEQLTVLIAKQQTFFLNTIKQVIPIKTDEQIFIGTYSDTLPTSLAQIMGADGEGSSAWWSGPWMVNGVLIALAAFSLGIMTLMVRRAAVHPVPTAEELAGIPELVGGDELILGDVDSTSSALPGVELDEPTIQHQQLVDQVSGMAQSNPDEVASLVKWWMRQQD